jgi:hypothetical protein
MNNADTKMTSRIAEIENRVLGGLVLDDRGNWVSIADKKASEEDFLAHLEAGRVLHQGQWVNIADAKKASPVRQPNPPFAHNPEMEETSFHPAPAVGPSGGIPPETTLLKTAQPATNRPDSTSPEITSEQEETAIGQFPPETKSIEIQFQGTGKGDSGFDDPSSYTMETGLFVVERPPVTSPLRETEAKIPVTAQSSTAPAERKTRGMPVFVPPSIPTWEKEESRQKKRTLLIGGIIAAVVGIAAIAVIVLQVVH